MCKLILLVNFVLQTWNLLFVPVVSAQGTASTNRLLDEAEAALKANDAATARQKCQAAIEIAPQSARARYVLGSVEQHEGNVNLAIKDLRRATALDPRYVPSHIRLGTLLFKSKAVAEAQKEFETAIRLGDPVGRAHYELGFLLNLEARYAAALPHLVTAVRARPSDPERLFQLFSTQLELKLSKEARQTLDALDKLRSLSPLLCFRLSLLLLQHNMKSEAEAELQRTANALSTADKVLVPNLNLRDIYLQIAQLHFSRKDYPGTLEYLQKVDFASGESELRAATLDLHGGALLATGDLRGAREKYAQAVHLDCSDSSYVAHSAWAEYLAGNFETALQAATTGAHRWPESSDIKTILAFAKREGDTERRRASFSRDWHLKGEGIVCCPCKTPCPCRSNARPTYGHCEPGGAMRITQGHYGPVAFDGFSFVTVSGSMEPSYSPAMLYVSDTATNPQVIALERLFQIFQPLQPIMSMKVKRVKMIFTDSRSNSYQVRVPDVVDIEVRRQLDEAGKPSLRTAALDYFSNTIEYALNVRFRLNDREANLIRDLSGRQANWRTIDLDARDYHEGKMLIQYADGSGFFNDKQRQLIKELGLPTLRTYPKTTIIRPGVTDKTPDELNQRSNDR
jgi:tetratricopeptide (TPR) repeat protein